MIHIGETAATLDLLGLHWRVVAANGVEEISTLFRYEVEAELALPGPTPDEVRGAKIALTIQDPSEQALTRTIHGIVAEAELVAFDNTRGLAKIVIRPEVFALTHGRDCYAMQDASVVDVLHRALASFEGPVRYSLSRTYEKHPYQAQYREDSWTYASRLMEQEGIYYWFDHDDGASTLVFSDDSRAAPSVAGGIILFREDSTAERKTDTVSELSFSSRALPSRFAVGSFDHEKPDLRIFGTVGEGKHEIYDAPGGGPKTSDGAAARAQIRREAADSARKTVAGKTSSVRLYPGRSVEIVGHPLSRLCGRFLIKACRYSLDQQREHGGWFVAQDAATSFRSEERVPVAKQAGLQMGVVGGPEGAEVHPDDLGRVRVQLHWDRTGTRDEGSGTWMRVEQRGAPGSLLMPRMGWNVATFNSEGAVEAPGVVCRIHDAEHPPSHSLPDNKTRVVFRTLTTPGGGSQNEIYFEDKAGQEEMFINASRDMNVHTQNVKTEFVWNDSLRQVGNTHERHVGSRLSEYVHMNQKVAIGGNETIETQASKSKSVSGDETQTIGGSRTLKVGQNHSQAVVGNRDLGVGSVMLDISLQTIAASAKDTLTMVGAAMLRASGASINEDTGMVGIQLIGGAKVEIAKKNRALNVDKSLYELVGGGIVLKTNKQYIDNADKTASWTVGGQIHADAVEISMEAEKTITIRAGSSVLTITTDTIKIESDEIDLSGAKLEAKTGQITHN